MLQLFANFKKIRATIQIEKNKETYLDFEQIPKLLIDSIILIEDRRFFGHIGIDLLGILRAFITNVLNRKIVEGASTITQQLVRRITDQKKKHYRRKFGEVLLAIALERVLSKNEILELYLNTCYFLTKKSEDIHGIQKASHSLYEKNIAELSFAELTFLAALIGRPLNTKSSNQAHMRSFCRQHLIIKLLYLRRKITLEERRSAEKENINLFDRSKDDFPLDTIDEYRRNYRRPKNPLKPLKRVIKSTIYSFKYDPLVASVCNEHQLPFHLIKSMIEKESSFNRLALSKKGAKGLMQLVDATFLEIAKKNKKEWTLQNIYEPAVNIEAGTLYLKKMIKYFSAKVPADVAVHFALSAYNAGPVRVNYGLTQIGLNNEAIAWENLKKYLPKVTCHYVESIMLTA
jgi:hypothetical protein